MAAACWGARMHIKDIAKKISLILIEKYFTIKALLTMIKKCSFSGVA
jgi:hypothetical protein